MKTKNINIYFIIAILVLLVIIYNTYRMETYENSNQQNKKLLSSNYKKDNKKNIEENFYTGYHGGHKDYGFNFPYSVANVPEVKSQTKQILNNLTFKYPSIYDDPYRYPNVIMPPAVIGCGGRRGACMGGSQVPIPNTLPPVNISEENIAPINLTVRGFDEGIQQVGTIQKVFGRDNFVYPLFGRKKYRNDNKWEYFVKFGQYGVILPLIPLRNYDELNTNDEVFIQGQKDKYRVTIYDEDIPQYLPFS